MANNEGKPSEGASTRTDEVGTWLKFHGLWNKARTKATVSLFSIPRGLPLCNEIESVALGTESFSYDFANVVSSIDGDRGLTCRACNLVFTQSNEQHRHFKSDLHRINLKRSLRGLVPLHDDTVIVHGTPVGIITGQEEVVDGSLVSNPVDEGTGDDEEEEEEEEEAADDILASAEDYLDGTAADYNSNGGQDEVKSHPAGNSHRGGTNASLQSTSAEGIIQKYFSKHEGPQYLFAPTTKSSTDITTTTNAESTSSNSHSNPLDNHHHGQPIWEYSMSVVAVHRPTTSFTTAAELPGLWKQIAKVIHSAQDKGGAMWCVLMLSSGRFAGAVFDGLTTNILAHKSFRRYTVRAKAGGSQSAHDNQGRKAQSAGAQLRRYGEQALREDVRGVLHEWTMRTVLFEDQGGMYDGSKSTPSHKQATLHKDDPRVRLVPFMVNKPSFEEVKAIHARISTVTFQPYGTHELHNTAKGAGVGTTSPSLSTLKIAEENDDFEKAADGNTVISETSSSKSTGKKHSTGKPQVLRLRSCKALRALHSACISGDLKTVESIVNGVISSGGGGMNDALAVGGEEKGIASMSSSSLPPPPPLIPGSSDDNGNNDDDHLPWTIVDLLNTPFSLEDLNTPLHAASENDHADVVYCLLCQGADPTKVDVRNRPPYFLARTKQTRDAFRRARGRDEEAEEQWAWDAAGVPTALTDEKEQLAREKEKEKKKRMKANKKERKERDEQEALKNRELQQLAAQEEIKAQQLAMGVCAQCKRSLYGVKALDVFDRRCCSTPCVMLLRRQLAAEAAEKRLAGGNNSSSITKISAETTNITWTDHLYNFSKGELNEASDIWRDFQTFALRHASLPSEEALRLCHRFQDKIDIMRNFSRIGMDPKGPVANRPIRILFLTTKRSLLLLNDRWYFELYVAMANQPNVDVTMWGTGCPGYRDEETTKQNLLRWFGETTFDIIHSTWTYQRTIQYQEDIGSALGEGHPQSRAREFINLPGDPIITVVIHEMSLNMEELLVRPHIIFVVYEQSMGIPHDRLIDTCGEQKHLLSNKTTTEWGKDNDCGLNEVLKTFIGNAPNKTMIAYMPHGIDVAKFDRVEEQMMISWRNNRTLLRLRQRNNPDKQIRFERMKMKSGDMAYQNDILRQQRASKRPRLINILLVGHIDFNLYLLRQHAQKAMLKEFTDQITQLRHPGYSLEEKPSEICNSYSKYMTTQQTKYTRTLLDSKVCLIGSGTQFIDSCRSVAWALRKYVEAIMAGCIVVGDVPGDINLARFVQERLTGQLPDEIGQSAGVIMSRYYAGNYSRVREEGRTFVRKHYSYTALVKKYFFPAIEAYRRGIRGVYRVTLSKAMVRNDRNETCSTITTTTSTAAAAASATTTGTSGSQTLPTPSSTPLSLAFIGRIIKLHEKSIQTKYIHPEYHLDTSHTYHTSTHHAGNRTRDTIGHMRGHI